MLPYFLEKLQTTNKLLGTFPGANGLKTGYHRAAGFCVTASAERGDLHLIAVIMGIYFGALRSDFTIPKTFIVLVFSVIGGLFGTAVLIAAAPALAEIALKFSSFEYFWLVILGLASAVFLALGNPLKGVVSLLLGLLVASVGLDNPAAHPRFTFGNAELAGGPLDVRGKAASHT